MNNPKIKICVTSAIVHKEYLWFCSAWYNCLFKCNLNTYEIEDAIDLPIGHNGMPSLVTYMFGKDDHIILIANNTPYGLIKYSIQKETMEILPIEFEEVFGNYGDEDDDYVYLPVVEKKEIVSIRKKNFDIERHHIECQGKGIQVVKKAEYGFVILETEIGDVVITDDRFLITQRIQEKPEGFEIAYNKYYPGLGVVCNNDEIIVFPRYSNMIFSVSKSENKAIQRGKKYLEYFFDGAGPIFSCIREMQGCIWLFSTIDNTWIVFDRDLNEMERIQMRLSRKVESKLNMLDIIKGFSSNLPILKEADQVYTLGNFLYSL